MYMADLRKCGCESEVIDISIYHTRLPNNKLQDM